MVRQVNAFTNDLRRVREAVISEGFTSETGPDGAVYTGISQYQVPQWYDRISYWVGRRIQPRLSCFRLNLEGELPHSWVHSDDICATYASVLYLNTPDQYKGGTAFWKHKDTGLIALPKNLTAEGHIFWTAEWKRKEAWEQHGFIPMKFNRFITYPTSLFHSRFPFEAFGKGPKDGRLIWICFYDLVKEAA